MYNANIKHYNNQYYNSTEQEHSKETAVLDLAVITILFVLFATVFSLI